MPVLLGVVFRDDGGDVVRHVVQIVGHTEAQRKRKYIIMDDSGILAEKISHRKSFMLTATWDDIVSVLEGESNFIIYPIFEKVYMLYDDACKRFLNLRTYPKVKHIFENLVQNNAVRVFLVDNSYIKQMLSEKHKYKSLTHYMWVFEINIEGYYIYFIMDPTYRVNTTREVLKYVIGSTERISLLHKI